MVKRFGPLRSTGGVLVVGDPGAAHLSLTQAGLVYWSGPGPQSVEFSWHELESVELAVPASRFRFADLVSMMLSTAAIAFYVVLAVLGDPDDPNLDRGGGSVTLRRRRDEELVLPLNRRLAGKYWIGSVTATERLLDRLISDSASRRLLDDPDALLSTVIRSARHTR